MKLATQYPAPRGANIEATRRWLMVFGIALFGLLVPLALTSPAHSESWSDPDTGPLTSELKTYLCAEEHTAPEWCDEYRAAKFSTSIADRRKAREEARRKAKEEARLKAIEEAKAEAERNRQLAALQARAAELAKAAGADAEATKRAEEAARARAEAWMAFLENADISKLTADQVGLVQEMAKTGEAPEADEILGFAYSKGLASLPKDLAQAYRHYGRAFLKGLKRVKPNLDQIWAKIPADQKRILLQEFS